MRYLWSGVLGFLTVGPIAGYFVSRIHEPQILVVIVAMLPGWIFLMLQDVLKTIELRDRKVKGTCFFLGFMICLVLSVMAK